jgi:hypothetical protein
MLYVESKTAPFIAELASIAGATKAAYPIFVPSARVKSPTSWATPTPIESR